MVAAPEDRSRSRRVSMVGALAVAGRRANSPSVYARAPRMPAGSDRRPRFAAGGGGAAAGSAPSARGETMTLRRPPSGRCDLVTQPCDELRELLIEPPRVEPQRLPPRGRRTEFARPPFEPLH